MLHLTMTPTMALSTRSRGYLLATDEVGVLLVTDEVRVGIEGQDFGG